MDDTAGKSIASEAIEQLRQRVRARERGDVILRFRNQTYSIDGDILNLMPFGRTYFRIVQRILDYTAMHTDATPKPPAAPPASGNST
jgi:hypothetical protein